MISVLLKKNYEANENHSYKKAFYVVGIWGGWEYSTHVFVVSVDGISSSKLVVDPKP